MSTDCQTAPEPRWSTLASKPSSSVIRDLLKLAARPEVISFAGGLPSPAGVFALGSMPHVCSSHLAYQRYPKKRAMILQAIKVKPFI